MCRRSDSCDAGLENMSFDELNKPLGLGPRAPQKVPRDIPYGAVAVGGCGLLLASLVTFSYIVDDKRGGEPFAQAIIEPLVVAPVAPVPVLPPVSPSAASGVTQATEANGISFDGTASVSKVIKSQSADQIEQMSGVKIVRGDNGKVPGAMIIEIPDRSGVQLTPSPDKRLIEPGKLPKIGADGVTSLSVYARPVVTAAKLKADAPRIALVFGGLGLSDSATADAISILPGEISLAFAPYGKGLERQVRQARDNGHEVLLQVPMQSFDYPANNPGPETLLSDADAATNLRDLHVLMTKFTGYIGVMTYQGGKFTAESGALSPVLHEISARGLMILDDGSSPRSLVSALAPEAATPFVHGDVLIDAPPKPEAIAAALTKLEAQARSSGGAVGVANGYPASISQLANWAKGLEARGIALVPVSAFAGHAAKPLAER